MIYFVKAETVGLIKIGYTLGDPAARMADLQTGSPVRLTLLGSISGDRPDEKRLHQQFAHARSHGEWFWPCPDLLSFIETNVPKRQAEADPLDDFWGRAGGVADVRHRIAFNDWKNHFYDDMDRLETAIERLPGSHWEDDEERDAPARRAADSFHEVKQRFHEIPVLAE